MNTLAKAGEAPNWLVAEMPPGYRTRIEEVERMTKDLQVMWRFGRLLWDSGAQLDEAVRGVFTGLKFDVQTIPCGDIDVIAVRIDRKRRLLIHISPGENALEKKSPDVAAVFRILHEIGADEDRVVLVINPHVLVPPAERPALATPEALAILKRLGVNVLPASAVFKLWTLGLQDAAGATKLVERLHEQDGGMFLRFDG